MNEKYSMKDLSRQDFTKEDARDFNDTEIFGSAFSQKEPYTDVFPPEMRGVTFNNCNLDNCNIPDGNTVIRSTNKHFKEQEDGEIWFVGSDLKPIRPRDERSFDECNLSKDPADIVTQAAVDGRQVSATKKRTITQLVSLKRTEAMNELMNDEEKLKQILISEGKI